jgi:hypothetical protein
MSMAVVLIKVINDEIRQLVLLPGRSAVEAQHCIHLILQGSDASAHYSDAFVNTRKIAADVGAVITENDHASTNNLSANPDNIILEETYRHTIMLNLALKKAIQE